MKVKEFIDKLRSLDQEAPVVMKWEELLYKPVSDPKQLNVASVQDGVYIQTETYIAAEDTCPANYTFDVPVVEVYCVN